MSSIRDVAKQAGVSVATVSRALANPEKVSQKSLEKVNRAIKALGYRPNLLARNFRSARSHTIVILVPDITNPFFSQVIQAIEDKAQQRGYAVLLCDTRDSVKREQQYIQKVENKLADGLIQLRPERLDIESTERIPLVYSCACENLEGFKVRVDNSESAKTAVDYLVSLGHSKIGVITGLADNAHSKERLLGYKKSLQEAGLELNEKWIFRGDFTLVSGQSCALEALKMKNRPTAIFCMSDQMAIGAIQVFQSQGLKIPNDISIVGFDDIPFSQHWFPSLTTVTQPYKAMGEASVDMLIDIIENPASEEQDLILPTEFAIRNSTKRFRQ